MGKNKRKVIGILRDPEGKVLLGLKKGVFRGHAQNKRWLEKGGGERFFGYTRIRGLLLPGEKIQRLGKEK